MVMALLRRCRVLVGDMQELDAHLAERNRHCHPVWILLDGLVSLLRGVAQVIFVNNPLSGALILIGLMCSNVLTGLAAAVSVLTALLVSKVLDLPCGSIRAGLTSFSACLVGTVTVELMPLLNGKPADLTLFLWVVLMSALSVPVGAGLGNILGTFQLPAFTLPFNAVTSVLFICLTIGRSSQTEAQEVAANVTAPALHWDQVLLGSVYSMGQVYASYTLAGSVLMYVGCLLCSPILTAASYVGGLVGTLLGVVFSSDSYELVYSGVWGYNGILAAGGILFFLVPSPRAVMVALLNAVFATMVQAALAASLSKIGLPVFTFPFVISTLLMLAVTSDGEGLKRVRDVRYPELHLRERPQRQLPQAESSHRLDQKPTTSEAAQERGSRDPDLRAVPTDPESTVRA